MLDTHFSCTPVEVLTTVAASNLVPESVRVVAGQLAVACLDGYGEAKSADVPREAVLSVILCLRADTGAVRVVGLAMLRALAGAVNPHAESSDFDGNGDSVKKILAFAADTADTPGTDALDVARRTIALLAENHDELGNWLPGAAAAAAAVDSKRAMTIFRALRSLPPGEHSACC